MLENIEDQKDDGELIYKKIKYDNNRIDKYNLQ